MTGGRNRDLDGLRGMAALSVALGHCFLQVTSVSLWQTSLVNFPAMPASQIVARVFSTFFPSDAAVAVFFVLSGHVLWESFRKKNMQFVRDLPDYLAARAYRLLPVTIAALLPVGLLAGVAAHDLVANMFLLSHSINTVLWSLQVEAVASAMLFVLWGLTKGRVWKMLIALLLAIALLPASRGNPYLMFMPAFILGAGITSIPPWVWRNTYLFLAGLALLVWSNLFLGHGGIDRCLEIGAATMVVGAVSQHRLPFLHRPGFLFLGDVSYPFYLSHLVGLLLAQPYLDRLHFASPYPMFVARAALSIPPALFIAWLLHVLVEVPAQRGRLRPRWPSFLTVPSQTPQIAPALDIRAPLPSPSATLMGRVKDASD